MWVDGEQSSSLHSARWQPWQDHNVQPAGSAELWPAVSNQVSVPGEWVFVCACTSVWLNSKPSYTLEWHNLGDLNTTRDLNPDSEAHCMAELDCSPDSPDNGGPKVQLEVSQDFCITLVNAYSLCVWCLCCIISWLTSGCLVPYQAIVYEEMPNYYVMRAHMFQYLEQPLQVTYRCTHYLAIQCMKKAGLEGKNLHSFEGLRTNQWAFHEFSLVTIHFTKLVR